MKTIRIILDYGAYPVWIYNEKDEFISNAMPEDVKDYDNLDKIFKEIEEEYESLFLNNQIEFDYIGFENEADKEVFINKINKAVESLKENVGPEYKVKNPKLDL